MLRVRPVHFTSRMEPWERLLTALGMVKTVDDGAWQEFDAGSGRLALQHTQAGTADDGTTSFGVEVGDLEEFARRTNLAGGGTGTTPAELVAAGPSATPAGSRARTASASWRTKPPTAPSAPAPIRR